MFPAGAPGVALLLLRVSMAAAILEGGSDCQNLAFGPLIWVAVAAQSLLLCIGLMTPVVSVIACVFDLLSLLVPAAHTDMRFIVLSSLNAAAIALLGPGAYSLDARLFGRRLIVFRSDGRPARH
jgi:uncharacterized membrane protein YphA (DoxX/SURF4 family)